VDAERVAIIKGELARLARKKKARQVDWSRQYPTEWTPTKVIDPRSEEPFTRDGAWEFLAEKLEDQNTLIEEIDLDRLPGKKAYVMKIPSANGEIYIKVQFGNGGKIKGWSFHY
jgi:hypothetical protein